MYVATIVVSDSIDSAIIITIGSVTIVEVEMVATTKPINPNPTPNALDSHPISSLNSISS